jgi:hypothetical protein
MPQLGEIKEVVALLPEARRAVVASLYEVHGDLGNEASRLSGHEAHNDRGGMGLTGDRGLTPISVFG